VVDRKERRLDRRRPVDVQQVAPDLRQPARVRRDRLEPGTLIVNGNEPAPPIVRPLSRAANIRSNGRLSVKRCMRSSFGSAPKYWPIARNASVNSSRSVTGRTSKLT
jgi:hypothetical protein